jgi:hypothetical protein
MQAVVAGLRDSHADNVTDFAGLFINYHGLEPGRAPNPLARLPARFLDQKIDRPANRIDAELTLLFRQQSLKPL